MVKGQLTTKDDAIPIWVWVGFESQGVTRIYARTYKEALRQVLGRLKVIVDDDDAFERLLNGDSDGGWPDVRPLFDEEWVEPYLGPVPEILRAHIDEFEKYELDEDGGNTVYNEMQAAVEQGTQGTQSAN